MYGIRIPKEIVSRDCRRLEYITYNYYEDFIDNLESNIIGEPTRERAKKTRKEELNNEKEVKEYLRQVQEDRCDFKNELYVGIIKAMRSMKEEIFEIKYQAEDVNNLYENNDYYTEVFKDSNNQKKSRILKMRKNMEAYKDTLREGFMGSTEKEVNALASLDVLQSIYSVHDFINHRLGTMKHDFQDNVLREKLERNRKAKEKNQGEDR